MVSEFWTGMNLNLINRIEGLAVKKVTVAIGVRNEDPSSLNKCLEASRKAEEGGFATPILIGEIPAEVKFRKVESTEPEKTLLDLLYTGGVDAGVRGTAKAGLMLKLLKELYGIPMLGRIALLESGGGHSFFFAPVGVDEGLTLKTKINLVLSALELIEKLGVQPRVAILSGGRFEDLGRSFEVDKTLAEGEFIVSYVRLVRKCNIKHYGILVENAVKDECNFILAPDGITGNLMYRTLIHLGFGKSHGALYVGLEKVLVDTSRAAPLDEYFNAMVLASAFANLKRNQK